MSEDARSAAGLRDRAALARVEVFLAAAVATVLVVRSVLAVTGYPQIGGGGLHVAHVLWGGLLMGAALVMVQIMPGTRARGQAAFVGGIGFGLFIDEVGKFVTKDVNYFFRPAVAIIYAVLVGFFIVSREILLRRPLDDTRRLAIAADAVSDLAMHRLDAAGRNHALRLLDGLEKSPIVDGVRKALNDAEAQAARSRVTVVRDRAHAITRYAIAHRLFRPSLRALFVLQLLGIVGQLLLVVLRPDIHLGAGSRVTDWGTEISTVASAILAGVGFWRLEHHNLDGALRMLYRSTLVTLLVTEIFVFVRYEWSALLGFAGQSLVLVALNLADRADDPDAAD